MIAELFYPKELKNIIADLRAKDDLNEEALKRMNAFIYKRMAVYFGIAFFAALCCLFYTGELYVRLVFFCLSCIFIFSFIYELVPLLKSYPILYTNGRDVSGTILNIRAYGIYGITAAHRLRYSYAFESKEISSETKELPNIIKLFGFKKGDDVVVYYDSENPERSVPLIPSLQSLFYLKKGE